jgi:hypothetical protein
MGPLISLSGPLISSIGPLISLIGPLISLIGLVDIDWLPHQVRTECTQECPQAQIALASALTTATFTAIFTSTVATAVTTAVATAVAPALFVPTLFTAAALGAALSTALSAAIAAFLAASEPAAFELAAHPDALATFEPAAAEHVHQARRPCRNIEHDLMTNHTKYSEIADSKLQLANCNFTNSVKHHTQARVQFQVHSARTPGDHCPHTTSPLHANGAAAMAAASMYL